MSNLYPQCCRCRRNYHTDEMTIRPRTRQPHLRICLRCIELENEAQPMESINMPSVMIDAA